MGVATRLGWATPSGGPELVLFGHEAIRGLQRYRFAIGLDTGCCYGGQLTALILPERRFVQVKALGPVQVGFDRLAIRPLG